MKRRMILLTNTCPFDGEVFLRNELKWVPRDQAVSLYPIFAGDKKDQADRLNDSIEVRKIETEWKVNEKIKAGWNTIRMLLVTKEGIVALNKPNPLRNFVKACKFAYIAELRFNRIVQQLRKEHDKENGYILYSYWLYEVAYIAARLKEVFPLSCFISRCHGFDLYEIRHANGYLPFRNYLMRKADAVFPISEDGKKYISEKYSGKWDDKVWVMRLGTDDFGMNSSDRETIPTIVSCSNLVDVKRIDRIIETLKAEKQQLKWYHFGDGPLREYLEQMAQELPLGIEYKFMGAVPNSMLMRFYQENHVDAFINVSSSEGIPVSIMEAISFGIPVVATDVGGTHEIVHDGMNGYLLPSDFTNEMLSEAISKILDEQNSDRLRKQARIIWENTCDASVNFETFYRTITQYKVESLEEE